MRFIIALLFSGLLSTSFAQTTIEEVGTWCSNDLQLKVNLETGSKVLYWSKKDEKLEVETNAQIDCSVYGSGLYHVLVEKSDGSTETVEYTVAESPLIADFTGKNYLAAGVTYFEDASTTTEAVVSWHWEFDNGETSDLKSPKIMFKEERMYTVKLTVKTNTGCEQSITKLHLWQY